MKGARLTALIAVSVALGMVLSYVEFVLPPIYPAIPGIKLGLANAVVIFMLYKSSPFVAIITSLIRATLSGLLFASPVGVLYSIAGASLSLAVMMLLKRTRLFTPVGVSIVGGVSHNAGQILVAILLLGAKEISFYMIPLAVSGTLAGVGIGIASGILIKKIDLKKFI